ncbi:thiopeptide-type bacteriocin biosynthesis protein [Actinoallomurus purpureus]|uniref:thiopeptide-type bacteriocin biosynthesis protein n=1 Tax=Actinoallomurus purpureus TaxID=478114 RepID=UPI002092F588|nr:thiopeptide-type bacteriocin biosynthesis protein [Actinoallomurus purpureus]MCO6004749.1 thiopeptide-type bacteriocin biosynthesis protein [Actinoallomurus purpureus]
MDDLRCTVDTDTRWRQTNLTFGDWQIAEQAAVAFLGPRLTDAENAGHITAWWFVRKRATWRLRYLPTTGRQEQAAAVLDELTHDLLAHGGLCDVATVIYEPETHAFGGPEAMQVTHVLFHADSRHLLNHLQRSSKALRHELGLLLGGRLMRAAGQDWYEQGDIWAHVAAHRSTGDNSPLAPDPAAVRLFITARDDGEHSPLRNAPAWATAFEQAGWQVAELAQRGTLTRGLRAILAHHVLFAWNRAGVAAHHQALLAATASEVVFGQGSVSAERTVSSPPSL